MNLFFMMLKIIQEAEQRIAFQVVRFLRQSLGYSKDATIHDIGILHDSPHFIIVNKHEDVLINHVNKDIPVTVEKQLERLYPDLVDPKKVMSFFFCHRLDYSTSGILCIPRHKKACAGATKAFESRNAHKFYLAIVRGHVSKDFLTVNEGVGEDLREAFRNIRMAVASSKFCSSNWRSATTHIVILERGLCYGYPATKVLMKPITGRRHQLRLHCSHIGHTIVGDYTYSNRKDLTPFRMFLHAYRLVLPNKVEPLDITTEDPFTPEDYRNEWIPCEKIRTVQDAFDHLALLEDKR